MEKFKSLVRLIVSMLLSVLSVFLCGFIYLNDGSSQIWTSSELKETVLIPSATQDPPQTDLTDTKPIEEDNSSKEESSSDSQEAITVGSDAQSAIGKITRQFISSSNANLSYNNVHINNSTGLSIDLKSELLQPLKFKIQKGSEPQVLIVHTHATETYMSESRDYYTASDVTRTTDNSANMINIGNIIAERLRVGGFSVLHDTTQHDKDSYSGSYSKAEKTITEYLNKYPSIKIVIDVHRDSISLSENNKVGPTVEIDGKNAAQVMLCMGSQSGAVTGFPNWRENFRLAARFQQTMEVMYPGLARPMLLMSKKYNEHLTTGSMLLEVGTEANSLSEAAYSAELVGNCLINLLNTLG